MGAYKKMYLEIVKRLKNPEGIQFGRIPESEKPIVRDFNDALLVEFKYMDESTGKLEWHSVGQTGNFWSTRKDNEYLHATTIVRIKIDAPDNPWTLL